MSKHKNQPKNFKPKLLEKGAEELFIFEATQQTLMEEMEKVREEEDRKIFELEVYAIKQFMLEEFNVFVDVVVKDNEKPRVMDRKLWK